MEKDKKTPLTTADIESVAKVEEKQEALPTLDSVVDEWFGNVKRKLNRDTATRNILYGALPDLKTRLNEVKA